MENGTGTAYIVLDWDGNYCLCTTPNFGDGEQLAETTLGWYFQDTAKDIEKSLLKDYKKLGEKYGEIKEIIWSQ